MSLKDRKVIKVLMSKNEESYTVLSTKFQKQIIKIVNLGESQP